ncbi:hypothetical protein AAKU55_005499 [Oxalobacteraceae bacterium GrIS 1.11]
MYGLRNWVEQSYKQMKDELGWADFMVRNDRAIRRHWEFVCCAFCFCWWHEVVQRRMAEQPAALPALSGSVPSTLASVSAQPLAARKKINDAKEPTGPCWPQALRAVRAWLTPAYWLTRCWNAFANTPPPPELAMLIEALMAGDGVNYYLRI